MSGDQTAELGNSIVTTVLGRTGEAGPLPRSTGWGRGSVRFVRSHRGRWERLVSGNLATELENTRGKAEELFALLRGRTFDGALSRHLIDHGFVSWFGNCFACGAGGFHPSFLRFLQFRKGRLGCFSECRTGIEIGDIRNVSTVLFAIENVDVVIFHSMSPDN